MLYLININVWFTILKDDIIVRYHQIKIFHQKNFKNFDCPINCTFNLHGSTFIWTTLGRYMQNFLLLPKYEVR